MANRRRGRVAAAAALVGAVGAVLIAAPLAAQQPLDPGVAGPLMQMINAAGLRCQAGDPQACAVVAQLQQAGNELAQAQFACQQGNPQACVMFQAGAQQVLAAYQQQQAAAAAAAAAGWGGGGVPPAQPYTPQQMQFEHQQRMQQQQMQFQQHQDQMAQQRAMQDLQHQRFMEQLRR